MFLGTSVWLHDPRTAGALPLPLGCESYIFFFLLRILSCTWITTLVSEVVNYGVWVKVNEWSLPLPLGRFYSFVNHMHPKQWGYFSNKSYPNLYVWPSESPISLQNRLFDSSLRRFLQPNMLYFLPAMVLDLEAWKCKKKKNDDWMNERMVTNRYEKCFIYQISGNTKTLFFLMKP